MKKYFLFLDKYIFYIITVILLISIYPWSIKDFLYKNILMTQGLGIIFKEKKVVSNEIRSLSENIKKSVKPGSNMLFISKNGTGYKDFYMFSYDLYPRNIYWISNINPGTINNWWLKNDLSEQAIHALIQEKHIKGIIYYDFLPDYKIINNDSTQFENYYFFSNIQ
jgi:hypothetical protein